jgi:anti-sigma B factor antagonist
MSLDAIDWEVGDVTVISLSGAITLGAPTSQLREWILEALNQGRKKILLNLGEVYFIDSSGLGELVSAYTSVTGRGGRLKLLNLNRRVRDLLQITKLYTVFEVFDDEGKALASFTQADAAAL